MVRISVSLASSYVSYHLIGCGRQWQTTRFLCQLKKPLLKKLLELTKAQADKGSVSCLSVWFTFIKDQPTFGLLKQRTLSVDVKKKLYIIVYRV